MANRKGPAWFRVYTNNENLFLNLDDAAVGRGVKCAFEYIRTHHEPKIDEPVTKAVFDVLKIGLDETIQSYKDSVEAGKIGARIRYGK